MPKILLGGETLCLFEGHAFQFHAVQAFSGITLLQKRQVDIACQAVRGKGTPESTGCERPRNMQLWAVQDSGQPLRARWTSNT